MQIKLDVYCKEDLEAQCEMMLRMLENCDSLKEIKKFIERR